MIILDWEPFDIMHGTVFIDEKCISLGQKTLCVQKHQFLKLLESKNKLHHWKVIEKLAQKMVWFIMFGYVVTEILRFENH